MSNHSPKLAVKSKIPELDFVRAFAIIAVVLIHSTSEATVIPESGSLTQIFFYTVNKLGAFAVPVFIILSGIVLFYRYFDQWKASDSLTFYKKRIISVVYPYLAFSLLYYFFYQYLYNGKIFFDSRAFLDLLPLGDAAYHLYYMIIIIQFYLLFPIFITLAKQSRLFERYLILIGLLIQGGFYVYIHWFNTTIPNRASISLTYFALFLIGAAIGIHYSKISAWIERNLKWIILLTILIAITHVGMHSAGTYWRIKIENTWYMLVYNAYALLMTIALIGIGKWILKRSPMLSKPFIRLGKVSFGVYLVHPAVLSSYKMYFPASGGTLAFSLNVFIGFIAALFGTWLIVEAYYLIKQTIRPSKKRPAKPIANTGESA